MVTLLSMAFSFAFCVYNVIGLTGYRTLAPALKTLDGKNWSTDAF